MNKGFEGKRKRAKSSYIRRKTKLPYDNFFLLFIIYFCALK